MQSRMASCSRCRGTRSGLNKRTILHLLLCKRWLGSSSRLMGLVVITATWLLAFPESRTSVFSAERSLPHVQEARVQAAPASVSRAIRTIEAFLERNKVAESNRRRLAESIVASAKKHNLNPRLLASIMIVESRGNPHAISGQAAVGVMQIHVATWGETADREDINLFRIEDNVDFGARILKNYVSRFGVWDGVKRYNGFIPGDPIWEESAQRYLTKVQEVYEKVGTFRQFPSPIG